MTFTDQQRGVLTTDLARLINFTVLFMSLAAQYTPIFDVLVFRPSDMLITDAKSEALP